MPTQDDDASTVDWDKLYDMSHTGPPFAASYPGECARCFYRRETGFGT
jgi:hypothetical protein